MNTLLEAHAVFTPFGIRFWDPVMDTKISDGLIVKAHPVDHPSEQVTAYRTHSGVYTFSHLPGMRDIEYGVIDIEEAVSPASTYEKDFVISVSDLRQRYLSVSFRTTLPLPHRGVFLSDVSGSPASNSIKGFYLYSTSSRSVPNTLALVRGELREAENQNKPAAHALVRITTEDGDSWFGLADDNGEYVVVMPYPRLQDEFDGSPQTVRLPLHEHEWNLELEIFYSPLSREVLPSSDIPAYASILGQTQASLVPTLNASPAALVSQMSIQLNYFKSTITRTDGLPYLLVAS